MRKFIQENLLGIVSTIAEANGELSGLGDDAFVNVLSDEQEAMVSIGETIEQSEGEEAPIIKILEEYCELLWLASQELDKKEKYIGSLNCKLADIEAEIKGIRRTREILFMPYKSSMWDCMETIWEAASEDPNAEVYVVPIPYCDRKEDGSAGVWHNERDLMPKYVQTVNYKEYSLEQHRPDVIFIHNPFDACNKVTSVDSKYYSNELKKYTDKLVYVPYFSLGEHLPESQSLLPAYVNADYIVLGKESMMEDIDESIPREKMLIEGWPKDERIIKVQKDQSKLEIPKEWEKILKDKKVIFYNTSITNLLNKGEEYLDKLEELIELVSDMDHIAVIWRPHPLLEATIKSMKPELFRKYQDVKKRFVENRIGIIDTSPEAATAVVLSDAYMGDHASSIVELFKVLNKPCFYTSPQCYEQNTWDELESDFFYGMQEAEDGYYAITFRSQLLCKIDKKTLQYTKIARLPGEYVAGRFSKIQVRDGKVYIIGTACEPVLLIYDLKEGFFKQIFFEQQGNENQCRFWGSVLYEQYLYILPGNYHAIIKFDCEKERFEYITAPLEALRNTLNIDSCIINPGSVLLRDRIYMPSADSNLLLAYHITTNSYEMIEIGDVSERINTITADGSCLWLVSMEYAHVYCYDTMDHSVRKFELEEGDRHLAFSSAVVMENKVVLLAGTAQHSYSIDKTNYHVNVEDKLNIEPNFAYASDYYAQKDGMRYVVLNAYDVQHVILRDYSNRSIRAVNFATGETNACKPVRFVEAVCKGWTEVHTTELWENDTNSLSEFLYLVAKNLIKENSSSIQEENLGSGKRIYLKCIEEGEI